MANTRPGSGAGSGPPLRSPPNALRGGKPPTPPQDLGARALSTKSNIGRQLDNARTIQGALNSGRESPYALSIRFNEFLKELIPILIQADKLVHPSIPSQTSQPSQPSNADLLQAIQKIGAQQKTTPREPHSWSSIAAAAGKGQTDQQNRGTNDKTITINIQDKEDREQIAALSGEALIDKIRAGPHPACKEIHGVRKLPSGDIQLHTASVPVCEILRGDREWTKVIAKSAKTARKFYAVMVQNVRRIGINTAN